MAFRQVVGDGHFWAKSPWQRVFVRKIGLREQPSKSSGGAPGLAIPGAGGDGRAGRGGVREDRPGDQGQFREAAGAAAMGDCLSCQVERRYATADVCDKRVDDAERVRAR